MKHLKTLVAMQLRDKLDISFLKNKKLLLRNSLLFILKFSVITFLIQFILNLCCQFGLFYYSESPRIMILVLTICLGLSVISCTYQLMQNLFFSEDNKVLITLPVRSNKIFISKIIVFYLYELIKSFGFLIPITLSCTILLVSKNLVSPLIFLWFWIPTVLIIALPVLLGGLLSIPTMLIYRQIKKNGIIEASLFFIVLIAIIALVVNFIGKIPENIDLLNQWPTISRHIRNFLLAVEERLFIMSNLISSIIGEKTPSLTFEIQAITFLKFGLLVLACVILFILNYFVSRPIFFKMMAKNFETNKNVTKEEKNKKHSQYFTFINKEFKINLRSIEISVNYLMVYIIVPILIMFLNAMYKAMDTRTLGDMLIYAFNILLICLPFFASNALVATYYSKEGRAGYIKKTKPIVIIYPLLTKLFFNVIFSFIAILVTVCIFGHSVNFNIGDTLLIFLAIFILHLGHMLYSAMLDIMNPQNEQYATTGVAINNPNENKSTILAFVLAFVYAVIAYKLLDEAILFHHDLTQGIIKLLMISTLFFGSVLVLFMKRIKAYYYELQG